MYKHLYDSFKHWYRGGSIYLYSDPHFGDELMSESRGITDEQQLTNIRKKIGKNDTIIFLGDIGDPTPLKRIKGYKILIMGNHDKGASKYKDYFDEIYEGPLFISSKLLLSHEPIKYSYALNIHGHDHGARNQINLNNYNVCAEFINFTPISLKEIVESGILKNIPDIHRAAIDRAKDR